MSFYDNNYERRFGSNKYYADKVSFFKELLKTTRRLIAFFILYIVFGLLCMSNATTLATITGIWLVASVGLVIYFLYFIIRCALEDNLRL